MVREKEKIEILVYTREYFSSFIHPASIHGNIYASIHRVPNLRRIIEPQFSAATRESKSLAAKLSQCAEA